MENYIYLSKPRIDMLYDQLADEPDKTSNSEDCSFTAKGGIGVAEGSTTNKTISSNEKNIGTARKMGILMGNQNLNYTDDITKCTDYLSGQLTMAWNSIHRTCLCDTATFWIGEYPKQKGDPCICTYLLLIGSQHNIVGNGLGGGEFGSTYSYMWPFFSLFYSDDPMYENNTPPKYAKKLSSGKRIRLKDSQHFSNTDQAVVEIMQCLRNDYNGMYSKYKFVANIQFNRIIRIKGKLIRYLVASPLFVSRIHPLDSRIVNDNEGKKLLITEDEYNKYKEAYFATLPSALEEAGLLDESKQLGNELAKQWCIFKGIDISKSDGYWYSKVYIEKPLRELWFRQVSSIIDKYFIYETSDE